MNEITKVIFRRAVYHDGDEEIIAFFPGMTANSGFVACYVHNGQHCEASFDFYRETMPCRPDEYAQIKHELEHQVGYRLKVMKRISAKDRRAAWKR